MKWKALGAAVVVVLLSALVFAQAQEQFLDVYTAQIKPEKRAEFDAAARKMVTANRQNHGDTWIAMETVYGPGNRVSFVSVRNSYAETEKGTDAFEAAVQKSLGKAGMDKLFQDYSQSIVNYRSELRRRRPDLSSNAPADADAEAKLIGGTRWLRTATVHIRGSHADEFEGLLRDLKAAREKATPSVTTLVSQAVAGQEGTVYYITTVESSMAGFDGIPSMQKVLGEEGYAKFLKTSGDVVERVEFSISRFLPDLSNPPEPIVAAAPDYWNPKPVMAAKAKTKPGEMVNAAEKGKPEDKNK